MYDVLTDTSTIITFVHAKSKKKEEEGNHIKTRQRNLEHWLIVHFVKMHPYFHLSHGTVVQKGYEYTTKRVSTG